MATSSTSPGALSSTFLAMALAFPLRIGTIGFVTVVRALNAPDATSLAEALRRDDAREIALLEAIGEQLASRPRPAVRRLVRLLVGIVDDTLPAVTLEPDMPARQARELAILRGADAALGGWTRVYGFGVGVLSGTVAALRDLDPTLGSVAAPGGMSSIAKIVDPSAFTAAVAAALQDTGDPLDRIQQGLGLDDTALAALFGVRRQAVAQWRTTGIPMARRAAMFDALAIVELLDRKLKPGTLPLLAATPVAALGGRTLLQALADDPAGTRAVYESAFDYALTA